MGNEKRILFYIDLTQRLKIMITLLNTQSDLNTQRLAVIWMRDNNAKSVTIVDPEFMTSFSLNGNKLSIDNRI